MRNKAISAALIAAAVTACAQGEAGNSDGRGPADPGGPLAVAVVRAGDQRARDHIEATGLLFAAQDVTVMAGVPGEVARVEANEGDFVKKGEPLAVLDQTEFRIAVRQAEHQAEAARLAVRQLELDHARNQALHESDSVTDSQVEQIALKLDLARSQWNLARDGLAMARKKLQDTVIRAPFDGYVTNRLVSVGSRITAMPPTVLFRVIDLAHLDFKMQIPDVHLAHVRPGDRVVVRFASLDREVEARVDEVVGSVDPRSMTFTAIVRMDNQALDHALKPGVMGSARVYAQGLADTVLLEKKLFKQLDLAAGRGTLFVADGDQARAREVAVEAVDDLRVRVVRGLADEDRVIASAVEALEDGRKVATTR